MVTRKVASCGGTRGVKQMEAGGKKVSKRQRRPMSGREITQIWLNITPGGAGSDVFTSYTERKQC